MSKNQADRVPMEYRAQVRWRCERQFINKPDIQVWIGEWTKRIDAKSPFTDQGLHIIEAPIDWRLISNSGTDEGIIRPVIGAGGWPLIPGSGIKGLFRRACPAEKLLDWCGGTAANGDMHAGVLRFHGAWPADSGWKEGLLDVAHPQQKWQVGFKADQRQNGHSAFGVVSLHKPLLRIGLSSTEPLEDSEWTAIEATLKRALERGIGGRTSACYGSSGRIHGDVIFSCGLEGQGPAAKLLDGTPEFRPTMFRAAVRGMALRLFGGLTDERTALQAVGELFGSLSREEGQNVGLLATTYTDSSTNLGMGGTGRFKLDTYATSGHLQWRLAGLPRKDKDLLLLAELLGQLHGLVMTLGGFGRSWRRPDHSIFLRDYYKFAKDKPPIGCHWQWREAAKLPKGVHVQSAEDLERLFQQAQSTALRWLAATNRKPGQAAPWREAFAPNRFGIWVRTASDPDDAVAIEWFHQKPEADRQGNLDPLDLNTTDIGGRVGRVNLVGRIWNRLLPLDAGTSPSPSPSSGSAVSQPGSGGAFARPSAAPTARPGAALARPPGPGSKQQTLRRQEATCPVSIDVWPGAYLESVVLFVDPKDHGHGPALAGKLNDGAGAGFRRLTVPSE